MNKLADAIGYTFQDTGLLRLALTHPSMGPVNNQRLEFLGDAVLEFIISGKLFRSRPQDPEGMLTHWRLMLVCEDTLSRIAKSIGLGQALLMDRGEELNGGRENPSVLCDAMEALLAAVFLDGGMKPAAQMVERLWPTPEEAELPLKDAKGMLQEVLQARHEPFPTYELLERSGPDHSPHFRVAVLVNGKPMAEGAGKTKKAAEQAAALAALNLLKANEKAASGETADSHQASAV